MSTDSAINLLQLLLPRTSTQTTSSSTNTSKEGVKAATDRILQSIIPQANSAQQNAGGFGSSAASLMYADAAARAGAYSEELNKTTNTTVTNKQAAAIDPRLALGGFLAYKLSESDFGKNAGKKATDWFSSLMGEAPAGQSGDSLDNWFSSYMETGKGQESPAGSMSGFFDSIINLFGSGGGEAKADGGIIQGDPNDAFQAVLAAIAGNKGNDPGFSKDRIPGTGNMGAYTPTSIDYGSSVARNFQREFGNFLRIGQGIVTMNPAAMASGVADMARYDANQNLLKGFANNDPAQIQNSVNTISNLQAFSDTFGTVGKAKGVMDSVSSLGGLTDMFSATESIAGKTLIAGLTGDKAITTANDALSIVNSLTGSTLDSGTADGDSGDPSSGNYTYGRYGGPSDTTRADGGFIGGRFQKDPVGKDRVNASLSGGEYVIPTDVVDRLGSRFFDGLVASLHKTTRG